MNSGSVTSTKKVNARVESFPLCDNAMLPAPLYLDTGIDSKSTISFVDQLPLPTPDMHKQCAVFPLTNNVQEMLFSDDQDPSLDLQWPETIQEMPQNLQFPRHFPVAQSAILFSLVLKISVESIRQPLDDSSLVVHRGAYFDHLSSASHREASLGIWYYRRNCCKHLKQSFTALLLRRIAKLYSAQCSLPSRALHSLLSRVSNAGVVSLSSLETRAHLTTCVVL